ncbi:polycomb group RING finger protein 3 isoform 3-T3 [Morphnus guianensis]
MRPERGGAPARLHSGRARLFPPLCFKLRAEPFNFTLLPPTLFFFFLIFFWRGRRRGAGVSLCLALPRSHPLLSLCSGARGRTGRGAEDRWWGANPPRQPRDATAPLPRLTDTAPPLPRQTPKMLTRKIKLWDINAHITCRLCNGYLIDATTVTECLHTFCRSCLVKYLEENNTCPTCRIVIHQSHPLQYIGHDRTMQDIVYKLVPGLQEAEMKKQREFYHKLGMEVPGDIKGETCSTKQHLDSHRNGETKTDENSNKETSEEKQEEDNDYHRSDEQLDILCNEEILGKDHTLKFVVVTRWRFKKAPLLLHYRPKMDLL